MPSKKKRKKSKKSKKLSREQVYKANIIMFKFFNEDDDTFTKEINRCMCVDYDVKRKDFSMENNTDYRRCKNKVFRNTDFCEKHQNCNSFLKLFTNGFEEQYNPKRWSHPYIEGSHNCYSYFLDDIQKVLVKKCEDDCKKEYSNCPRKTKKCGEKKPQPGHFNYLMNQGTLSSFKRGYQCPNMEKLIQKDNPNIKKTSLYERCPTQHYKGAMVVHKDKTFHFYKQNSDGRWSHKPGTQKVVDYDASNKNIYIPHFSNRDYSHKPNKIKYNDFCGYYCIPRNNYVSTNSI